MVKVYKNTEHHTYTGICTCLLFLTETKNWTFSCFECKLVLLKDAYMFIWGIALILLYFLLPSSLMKLLTGETTLQLC